jgi:hypothetical protein
LLWAELACVCIHAGTISDINYRRVNSIITGYEIKLPESKLFSESERVVIKEFVVTSYGES